MEKSEVLLYVTEDGTVKLEVTMESETVWLNPEFPTIFQSTIIFIATARVMKPA